MLREHKQTLNSSQYQKFELICESTFVSPILDLAKSSGEDLPRHDFASWPRHQGSQSLSPCWAICAWLDALPVFKWNFSHCRFWVAPCNQCLGRLGAIFGKMGVACPLPYEAFARSFWRQKSRSTSSKKSSNVKLQKFCPFYLFWCSGLKRCCCPATLPQTLAKPS